jgi:hypothetical protein
MKNGRPTMETRSTRSGLGRRARAAVGLVETPKPAADPLIVTNRVLSHEDCRHPLVTRDSRLATMGTIFGFTMNINASVVCRTTGRSAERTSHTGADLALAPGIMRE